MQNFGKFFGANTVDADIPNRTEICGVNESGKTTIKRAVQYVLNCRDDNGKEITGIRPHDESGNDYSGTETTCAVMFDLDGTEKELKKEFSAYVKTAIKNTQKQYLIKKGKILDNEIAWMMKE